MGAPLWMNQVTSIPHFSEILEGVTLIWAWTFLITHQEAVPARVLTNPVRTPKMIPKLVRARGGLLVAVLIAVWVGASVIISQFANSCRSEE